MLAVEQHGTSVSPATLLIHLNLSQKVTFAVYLRMGNCRAITKSMYKTNPN